MAGPERARIRIGNRFVRFSVRRHARRFELLLYDTNRTIGIHLVPGQCLPLDFRRRLFFLLLERLQFDSNNSRRRRRRCQLPVTRKTGDVFVDLLQWKKTEVAARVFYFYPFRNLFKLVEHTCSMFQLCWTRRKKRRVEHSRSNGESVNVFLGSFPVPRMRHGEWQKNAIHLNQRQQQKTMPRKSVSIQIHVK